MPKLSSQQVSILAALLASYACSAGLCANTVTKRLTSPDGTRDAVVFTRDCGATTDFSTQVALVPSGQVPGEGGNVFIAPRAADVRVEWVGNDTLLVHDAIANPNLKAGEAGGVTIRYATLQ